MDCDKINLNFFLFKKSPQNPKNLKYPKIPKNQKKPQKSKKNSEIPGILKFFPNTPQNLPTTKNLIAPKLTNK